MGFSQASMRPEPITTIKLLWYLLCDTVYISPADNYVACIYRIHFSSLMIMVFFKPSSRVYLTVIRGTPTVIQLLIMNFVVFGSVSVNEILVGSLAFGINSGAYVAEIVRSGIMSIDQGQTEAGRSLGLNFTQTMRLIIIPQAFKNVLPALVNEFIVLIKETSIIGYIGMMDLTKGAMLIQSRTYNAFMPLLAAAAIYLIVVMVLTFFMNKLERRLRTSER